MSRLPAVPARLVPPTPDDFDPTLRGPRTTARVGLWLGVCFGVAFLTGLVSHDLQADHPLVLGLVGPHVGGLYRVTQGLHVITGTAAVPLLLVKLWSVYPRLFTRPPRERVALLLHALERVSIGVLVAAAIFQLVTGLMNVAQLYWWGFSFRSTHFAVAWVAIGALVVHVGVKLEVVRAGLRREPATGDAGDVVAGTASGLTRRGLLRATGVAAGVAGLSVAGGTVPWLRSVSVFATRSGDGPQALPVNRSAVAAGVVATATAPDFVLEVVHGTRSRTLTPSALEALPQVSVDLPVVCVEGWSAMASWTGVRVRDLLALVGSGPDVDVAVTSLQTEGAFGETLLPAAWTAHDDTLLALRLNGQRLSLDHGFPCRVIAPDRPGVLQTKWVRRLEVAS